MTQPHDINIETIMQEIRQKIVTQHASLQKNREPIVTIDGERLPPEFYEHLYNASLLYDRIDVKMHVTKVNIPLIGPLLETIRAKIHQLVLFYVNQVAMEQIKVNTHLLKALDILAQELEKENR